MNKEIIANGIALVSSLLLVTSSNMKTKKNTLLLSTMQSVLNTVTFLLLGGYSGALTNAISGIRNFLSYKNALKKPVLIAIWLITIPLVLIVNKEGYLCLFPIVANTLFTIALLKKDVGFKWYVALNLSCWAIYNFIVKNYVGATFQIISTILSLIAVARLKKEAQSHI